VRTLRHVLWIGGPPGAGKSSIASRIVRRHGLRWYSADTRTWRHRDRALRAGSEAARRWEAMAPQARWAASTPQEVLERSLHRERGPMVIDDLRALPDSPLVVAEGSTLPAHALSSGIAERSRAVWLLPTRAFQRAALTGQGVGPNLTAFYGALGEIIVQEAREHGAATLTVDGSRGIDQMVAAVEELFARRWPRARRPGRPPSVGPCCARRTRRSHPRSATATNVPGPTVTPRRSSVPSSASAATLAATPASASRWTRCRRERCLPRGTGEGRPPAG
jgi:hypothetical protein